MSGRTPRPRGLDLPLVGPLRGTQVRRAVKAPLQPRVKEEVPRGARCRARARVASGSMSQSNSRARTLA